MNLIFIIIVSSVISLIGTMIGASIGVFVKNPSQKFIGGSMGFAGGLMLSVVAFDLIPEAMEKTGFCNVIFFYIIGISHKEIADILNINYQSSKNRLSQSLVQLRKIFFLNKK